MKRTVLLIYLMLTFVFVNAQDIKREEIEKVAKYFLSEQSTSKSFILNEYKEKDTVLFYLAHNNEDFVIVSNELSVNPILGYSVNGTYDGDNLPIQLRELLKSYSEEILAVKRGQYTTKSNYTDKWNHYLNKNFNDLKASVLPIINVNWNQGSGWNRFCPEDSDGPGGHVYVGCVAVSMAQSMSVFKHPTIGVGESNYIADGYGSLSVNYGETQYQWNLMSNTSADDYNSLLLYHCAVSVKMGFGPDGSGAYTKDIARALKNYFDYSSEVYWKSSTEDQAWIDLLKSELDAGRPISYGGNDGANVGHAYNLDGYNNSDAFHVNWGWSGAYNGYFQITSLTPNGSDYSKNAVAVLNIKPKDHSPTDIELSTVNFIEKLPEGSALAEIIVTDVDEDDIHDYEVDFPKPVAAFPICPFYADGDTLKNSVVLENSLLPNAEIIITATDLQGNTFSKLFVVNILKENYPPTNISISKNEFNDTIALGTFIGKLLTADQDAVDTFTYVFETNADPEIGKDNNKFLIKNDSLFSNFDFTGFEGNQCSLYIKSSDKRDKFIIKEIILNVNKTLSIFPHEIINYFKIYPNPNNSGLFNIQFDSGRYSPGENYSIQIYNLKGELIKSYKGHSSAGELSFQLDQRGLYILQLKIGKDVLNNKILFE